MKESGWVMEFPAAITVCDGSGVIVEMNERSRATFAEDGGAALIGKNLLDCHTGTAREKVAELLDKWVLAIANGQCPDARPVSDGLPTQPS